MNLKNKCAKCGKELVYFRMILMVGVRGYRRYALCDKCAEKVEKRQKAEGGKQNTEGRMQKAGA